MLFHEALETRQMLAGNVSVVLSEEIFRLVGDISANSLSVVRSRETGDFVITGLHGTTIDGKTTRTYAARNNITADLRDGDDLIILDRLSASNNVSVNLGAGNDAAYIKRGLLRAVDVFGDTGSDVIDITDSTFAKRLRVFAGEQNDSTALRAVRAQRGLEVTDTSGKTVLAMKQVSASNLSWFSGSNSRDTLNITDSDFVAFSAKLRGGNDGAYVRRTTFAENSPIDGGSGTNDINRQVFVVYDFSSGDAQGWEPQLSGRDPSLYGQPVTPEEFAADADGTFGIAPIDPDTGLSGSTYQIVYKPLVFLTKRLGVVEGLIAGGTYDVQIKTDVVVAGDGFNSRFLAGAVPVRPDITTVNLAGVEELGGTITIGGEEYVLSGASDDNFQEDALTTPTANGTLVRRSSGPATITVGSSGDAWAVFQAYFGDLAPETLQFRSFSIKLTPATSE